MRRPALAVDESDFRKLWAGDVVSQVGSQITVLALPFMAVATLNASGSQIGILQALYTLPFLLVPLPAGVWLERRPLRPTMISLNLVCAALVLSVPLASALGWIGLAHLYVIAVLGGAATVTSDIAKMSLVPRLVRADRLGAANSRINMGVAAGVTASPGLAGLLIGVGGAPFALVVDGATYVFCTAALMSILQREPLHDRTNAPRRDIRKEVVVGLRTVFATPPVRNIAIHASLFNGGIQLMSVALVVYFVRELGFSSTAYGTVLFCGGIGAVLGSLAAPALIRRLGHGPAMLGALAVTVPAFWVLPAVHGSRGAMIAWCSVALAVGLTGSGVGGVVSVTVRQTLTPKALHARMNASFQLMNFGTIPVGALAGGLLVDRMGAHDTLWVAAAVLVIAVTPLAPRAVRSLGKVLDPTEEDDGSRLPAGQE